MAPPKIERFVSISDLAAPKKRRKGQLDRFVSKTIFADNGCWEWVGTKNDDGYGMFSVGYKILAAHRWSYAFFVGELSPHLVIDHLCRKRACVNPDHLEQVTNKVNSERGANQKRICIRGHEHTPENSYFYRGRRWCKPCRAIQLRVSRARRKAVRNGTT